MCDVSTEVKVVCKLKLPTRYDIICTFITRQNKTFVPTLYVRLHWSNVQLLSIISIPHPSLQDGLEFNDDIPYVLLEYIRS